MTDVRISAAGVAASPLIRYEFTVSDEMVEMHAQWCHRATLVTIRGDIDAVTGDRVQDFATRFVSPGSALALDWTGVEFFAARGISALIAVDDACRTARVPWALVPNRVVSRVLQLAACDTSLPLTSSVPEALRQVTALTQARRHFALATTTETGRW